MRQKQKIKLSAIILTGLVVSFGLGFFVVSLALSPDGFLQSRAALAKNSDVGPKEEITIHFSQAMLPDSFSLIATEPAEKIKYHWENKNHDLVIAPEDFWNAETEYEITVSEGRSALRISNEKMSFNFSTVKFPRVIGFYPRNGQQDVVLDIEDPIAVEFDKSTDGFFMKFFFDPTQDVAYENNREKTRFRLLPKNQIKDGQRYTVTVFSKYATDSDDGYQKIYETTFETSVPETVVWEKNFLQRIEQAKRLTRARIMEGRYIDINLESQIMTLFEDGKVAEAFLVSSGKRGMDTPKGEFKIRNKTPRAWSKAYGLFMPNWMAIVPDGKFGIHELPEWPGGYKEGANHLGTPVSHGCVRLGVGAAKTVYDWAEIGTSVVIH